MSHFFWTWLSSIAVTFFKGTRDITHIDRTQKEGFEDSIRYTIQHSNPGDSGTYCILAKNQYGTDRAFVTIVVKQPKIKKEDAENQNEES